MTELRRTTRHRFRIAVAGTLGLAAALGAGMTGLLHLTLSDRLALADAATAAGALLILGEHIMMTVTSVGNVYESGLFVEDFTTFLATAPTPRTHTSSRPAPDRFDRVTVEDVTFTYPAGDRPQRCATSPSSCPPARRSHWSARTARARPHWPSSWRGCTCPQTGRIHWDDTDIADVDAAQLRRRIAVIFPDFLHYDLPARHNIGIGAVDHVDDLDAVRATARRAGADAFLHRLPDGYATVLSPEYIGGRDPSVGQWQTRSCATRR